MKVFIPSFTWIIYFFISLFIFIYFGNILLFAPVYYFPLRYFSIPLIFILLFYPLLYFFFFFLKYYSRLCSKIAFVRSRLCILALILLCIFSLYSTVPVILRNKDCCVRILHGDETRALYASEPLGRFKSHPMTTFLPYEIFNIYHY